MSNRIDVYQIVTDKILTSLKGGVIPWRQPWINNTPPTNLISKKMYRGINTVLLMYSVYKCPYWASYKQIQELGGNVKKGEKATMIIYWKLKENKDETSENFGKKHLFLKYYNVFNMEQTEGIEDKIPKQPVLNNFLPLEICENIVKGYINKPVIKLSS